MRLKSTTQLDYDTYGPTAVKQVTEAGVRDWLLKLKDVSYEMDDVLDEWNTAILRQQVEEGESTIFTKVCFPTPSSCFCFGKVNKAIHYHTIAVNGDQELIQHQKTSSLVDIKMIFGWEKEKEMLLSKLLRETSLDKEQFLVIPIVGMGGMGKTTLAQLVFNDERVGNHFDEKVWVCVSDPFDEIKVAKAITESLEGTHNTSNELETLLLCIKSHVESKKFLLVLDDVWTEDRGKWDNMKLSVILQACAKGSTVVVTTRKEGVGKMMRATNNMIHLDKLNDEDSLLLFNSIAFLDREEDADKGFGAIGKKIVKMCKGLPLGVKTLGSLVWCKKTREEWRDVLTSKIWELEEVEQQVFRPLLLSYYDLAPSVKRCLLYCAIFPKDYRLSKDMLIDLWMSQGYLNSRKNKEQRRNGELYFESLAMRSFFQDFSKDEIGNVEACKMHDIVHDFVQFLTKTECVSIEEAQIERDDLSGNKVRHLTLANLPRGPLDTSCYGCQSIRTLTVVDSKITAIVPGSILHMKCLRTLNLSCNKLNEVPKEIGELIHLRSIDLSRNTFLIELPEAVCDLYNLQTLNLVECENLEKLPKGMGKLINLKHLYVSYCSNLSYLPKGTGSLKSLQVLDWFDVCKGENDEALKLGDLGIMDQLRGDLRIGNLGWKEDDASEMEKAQLGNKECLSDLFLSFHYAMETQRKGDEEIMKAVQPHPNLESLYISNCHIVTSECLYWINSLQDLRKVAFADWESCQVLPALGNLPSLEILEIRRLRKVKKVGVEFLSRREEAAAAGSIIFPKLKQLFIDSMYNWEEWEGITHDASSDMITIMPCLSHLRIRRCYNLRALPDFLYKITTLRTLEIEDCSILSSEYEKGVGKQWHNISHIPNLTIEE